MSCFVIRVNNDNLSYQELVYDDGTTDATIDDDKGEIEEINPSDTHPNGPEASWTFYFNLVHPENQMNVKLGDCVELMEEDSKLEGKVLRCQFLLKDKFKVPWISGYEMVKTQDIPSLIKKGRKRKRTVVDEFPVSGDRVILDASECFVKLTAVKKIVCGLPLTDFEFGKPRGVTESTDVFSCGFRFDPIMGSSMHFVIPDFKTCFDPIVWEKFIEPPQLKPIVIVSCQDDPKSPPILRKEGSPRKSTDRRISFSSNLVQQFDYVDDSE